MDKMSFREPLGGLFYPIQSYFTCLGPQNVDKFFRFARFWSSGRGLGHRGILGDLYFQKWAPRLDESTISETCTSKNGKRVTEGAYSFRLG